MNLQRTRRFLHENFIFYLAGILVVLGIKYYYSQAECDSLLWILAPTTRWVELLSGIPFTYISGTGYVNHSLRLLIAPSCSGVRFMIITIATLVFSFVHIVATPKDAALLKDASIAKDAALPKGASIAKDAALLKDASIAKDVALSKGATTPKYAEQPKGALTPKDAVLSKEVPTPTDAVPLKGGSSPQGIPAVRSFLRVGRGMGWIAACVVFSWLFTVLVNGLRIIVAIYLPLYLERIGLMRGMLTSDRLHTMIGVVVYFAALLMLYRLVDYVVQKKIGLTRHSQKSQITNIHAGMAAWLVDRGNKAETIVDDGIIPREKFLKTLAKKCMPPIFWYFLMTLGLPFLNRAYLRDGTKFKEFAILIICCTVLILLPFCIVSLLHSRKRCRE